MSTPAPASPAEVAVFGGADAVPGDPSWSDAVEVGRRLASAGFVVLTGGYGGVMEAASLGAREAGGRTVGVLCAAFERDPNPHLSMTVVRDDLWERTRELIERAAAYVVLPGKSGTLAEVAFIWALHRAGCLGERPMVLLGSPWPALLGALEVGAMLDGPQRTITLSAGSPEEAVATLCRRLTIGPANP